MPIGIPLARGSCERTGESFQIPPVESEYVRQPNRLERQVAERAADHFTPSDTREETEGGVVKQMASPRNRYQPLG